MLCVLECRASVDYTHTSRGLVRSTLRTVRTIVERNIVIMHDLNHDDNSFLRTRRRVAETRSRPLDGLVGWLRRLTRLVCFRAETFLSARNLPGTDEGPNPEFTPGVVFGIVLGTSEATYGGQHSGVSMARVELRPAEVHRRPGCYWTAYVFLARSGALRGALHDRLRNPGVIPALTSDVEDIEGLDNSNAPYAIRPRLLGTAITPCQPAESPLQVFNRR
jgi:hypothetical protein